MKRPLFSILLALGSGAGWLACTPPSLAGRPCAESTDCLSGWVCAPSVGVCLERRACDADADCDPPLRCRAARCELREGATPDGGVGSATPSDGGLLQTSPCADRNHGDLDCSQGCPDAKLLTSTNYDPASREGVWLCAEVTDVVMLEGFGDSVRARPAPGRGGVLRTPLVGGGFTVR